MTTIHRLRGLAVALLLTFAVPAAAGENRGTAEEARDLVACAIAYYDEMGASAAFAKFNHDPAPEFLDRDLYIFVGGRDEGMVAHAVDPSLLGVKYSSFVDADGTRFGEEMREAVTPDGIRVDYKFRNPATGEIERKSSLAVLHDGYIFGVGIYKP
ncbi:MAG: cache domain-containing protein [Defluviicoccus sp.]|nr:cache domain-containing protein [Defluviicoccus sp.]MDE0277685.1 cache domain-containing protein [Defluviicoccus sp.]